MSRSVNKITLIGNVGQDPEVRTTSADNKLVKLSLATNHRWKDSSGEAQDCLGDRIWGSSKTVATTIIPPPRNENQRARLASEISKTTPATQPA